MVFSSGSSVFLLPNNPLFQIKDIGIIKKKKKSQTRKSICSPPEICPACAFSHWCIYSYWSQRLTIEQLNISTTQLQTPAVYMIIYKLLIKFYPELHLCNTTDLNRVVWKYWGQNVPPQIFHNVETVILWWHQFPHIYHGRSNHY